MSNKTWMTTNVPSPPKKPDSNGSKKLTEAEKDQKRNKIKKFLADYGSPTNEPNILEKTPEPVISKAKSTREISKSQYSEFDTKPNYQPKSILLSSKQQLTSEAKSRKGLKTKSPPPSHRSKRQVEDLKVFKDQLRRNEVENMHVRNEQWLQNRENKIYNELKAKQEATETECTYRPKTNKPPKKIIGSFLDRCDFDMQKRKLNQRELFDRDQSECTFQPQIAPKSARMAEKRHEMLQRLDYITGFNTEDLDTEYILQTGDRRAGYSNFDSQPQDAAYGTVGKKILLNREYDRLDPGHDDDEESRSVVDAGRIFFFCLGCV
jgi:hypothetical protein